MRKHHICQSNTIYYQDPEQTIIIGAYHHHFQYDEGNTNTSTDLIPGHLDLTSSAVFTSCEWKQCSASDGGAIYIATHNVELRVDKCQFLLCVAQSIGGGIYAHSSSCIAVQELFFHSCQSKTTDLSYGGGGIFLYAISTQIQIAFSTFCNCEAICDGAGVDIHEFYLSQSSSYAFSACRFIKCTNSKSEWCEGGALLLWNITLLPCTNSLFSGNEGWAGGAYGTNCVSCKPHYQMYFCFFHINLASYGNDIYFLSQLSNSPLLHCFSTSDETRIYNGNDYNWLPLGDIRYKIDRTLTC